jgi:hypothetical protein
MHKKTVSAGEALLLYSLEVLECPLSDLIYLNRKGQLCIKDIPRFGTVSTHWIGSLKSYTGQGYWIRIPVATKYLGLHFRVVDGDPTVA